MSGYAGPIGPTMSPSSVTGRDAEEQIGDLGDAREDVGRGYGFEVRPGVGSRENPDDDARPGPTARHQVADGVANDRHRANLIDLEGHQRPQVHVGERPTPAAVGRGEREVDPITPAERIDQ